MLQVPPPLFKTPTPSRGLLHFRWSEFGHSGKLYAKLLKKSDIVKCFSKKSYIFGELTILIIKTMVLIRSKDILKDLLRQKNKTVSVTNPSTILTGKKTGTAGAETKVTIGSGVLTVGVTVKALSTNTGLVYIGPSTVDFATGFQLSAGDQIFIPVSNLNAVYIDVGVTGEGVTWEGN